MSEWIDVPVAEVAKGDEIKVRGTGRVVHQVISYYYAEAERWRAVTQVDDMIVWFGPVHIDRLNITAVRRRTPEPQPKPGDWRCEGKGNPVNFLAGHYPSGHPSMRCPHCEVYRASGGWSRDTRDGQPWVMKEFGQASATVPIVMGSICYSLRKLADDISQGPAIAKGEPLADYYKRIGLDVRPVDRRGKR